MRKFILKVSIFVSSIFVLICLIIILINSILDKRATFRINEDIKYIVFGHSHPQSALNDSIIDKFSNFAESREAYFYTYIKARKILEQNDRIETVFIEFTNNQIIQSKNYWIWGDNFLSYRYPRYAPFMTFQEHNLLLQNNAYWFLNNLSNSTKMNLLNLWQNEINYSDKVGGFHYIEKILVDSIIGIKSLKNSVNTKNIELPLSKLYYLKKLIDFCKDHGKSVYLIRTPMHTKYSGLSNEKAFKNVLNTTFKTIEFLDFVSFPLLNSEYADLEHLNYKGAKKFSIWFNKLLKSEFLNRYDKQDFIENEIKIFENNL